MGRLTGLRDLKLCSSEVTDEGLRMLSDLVQLTSLNLYCCKAVTDLGLLSLFSSLIYLQRLELFGCCLVTDKGLQSLVGLRHLLDLGVSRCGGLSDHGLAGLAAVTSLTRLNLRSVKHLTDEGLVVCLRSLTNLRELDLSSNALTDQCVNVVCQLPLLHKLDLSSCEKLTDQTLLGLSAVVTCPVVELDLSQCPLITDKGLAGLYRLKRLAQLSLQDCNEITDEGYEL